MTPTITPSPLPIVTQTLAYLADLSNLGQILFKDEAGNTWLVDADGTDAHEYSLFGNLSLDGQYMVKLKADAGIFSSDGQIFVLQIYSSGHLINEITVEMKGGVDTYLSELTWSPDNKTIAFDYQNNVYLVHPDGTGFRQLTNRNKTDFYCSHIQWSPTGQKISFHCISNINPDLSGIYILTVSSREMIFVRVPYYSYSLAWTPDETHLFFVGFCYIGKNPEYYDKDTIYVVDADGQNIFEYWDVRSNPDLILSPDGKYIAFSGLDPYDQNGDEIFLIDTANLSLLADNTSDTSKYKVYLITDNRSNDSHPGWSPDSKHVVFSSTNGSKGLFVISLYDYVERQLLDFGKDPILLRNP
jgi:Tol biopolymer transport system component